MHIVVEQSNRFGKLSIERLESFERQLGSKLPDQFRDFLLLHNGGFPSGADETRLHHFFGLHDGPTWARFPDVKQIYGGFVPSRFLPFAENQGGDLYCISLAAPDRGSVYFWNHERDPYFGSPQEQFLSSDFSGFLQGLALEAATVNSDIETIDRALAEGLPADAPVYADRTMVDLAFEYGNLSLVKHLLARGAKLPVAGTSATTALHNSVRNDDIAAVTVLLDNGVLVDAQDPQTKFTALMLAASVANDETLELLLARGANPRLRNFWKKKAVDFARSEHIRRLLLDRENDFPPNPEGGE